jgi:hypothetical protein
VLKTNSIIDTPSIAEVKVVSSRQTEDIKRWAQFDGQAKSDLASQVRALRDARKRLSFLLSEIDQILKRK